MEKFVSQYNAFKPAKLGKLELKNRFMKATTFEGMTPGGVPGKRLTDFHMSIAKGGIGMTTLSYCTTEADGRIMNNMMWLHEGIRAELECLISGLKKTGVKVSGQVTHCGHFSQNTELQKDEPPKGPSKMFVPIGLTAGRPFAPAMTQLDIDNLVETYRDAAKFMKSVGFDALEIHFGHGYGLSQFISPKTNKRTDKYGGSHENRMRLPLAVLKAMRDEVGNEFPILGKISMTDAIKGGVNYDEGLEVAKTLDKAGIDGLIPSAGTSSYNSMYMFRGGSPAKGMIEMQENKLTKSVLKVMGRFMWKSYDYQPTYFLEASKRVKAAVKCPVIYIGGCSTRPDVERIFEAGFDFVQLGRALIKDPDFVKNAENNPTYKSGCTHCNYCVPLIQHPDGIRCVLNDEVAA